MKIKRDAKKIVTGSLRAAAVAAPARMLRSSFECEVRAIDEAKRQATFVASTERAVSMGYGDPEVLRMKGVRLDRYRKNPVLLDSHNRYELESVIGSCKAEVQGRELLATATYATTVRGENAWQLVKGGHVRAMSIGYAVNQEKVKRLRDGEADGEGEGLVKGPASVVNDWELLEISNVPVPADEDAVRRTFFEGIKPRATAQKKETRMLVKGKGKAGINYTAALVAAALDAGTRADAAGDDSEEEKAAAETCSECGQSLPRAAADEDEEAAEPDEKKGKKAHHAPAVLRLLPEETKRRQFLAITPKGLERVAEDALIANKTPDEFRALLVKAQADRYKPVGTTEPAPIAGAEPDPTKRTAALPAEITDDVLVRSLENLTS